MLTYGYCSTTFTTILTKPENQPRMNNVNNEKLKDLLNSPEYP